MRLRYVPILVMIVFIAVVIIFFVIQTNSQNELIEKQKEIVENMMQNL
jgi:hypothetical protein